MKSNKKHLLGTILTLDSPEIAEILSLVGFDWIMIDMEHSALDIKATQRIIQAVKGDCKTIVRLPVNEEVWIKRILETGCSGIMVPLINTIDDAKRVIKAAKYPPIGSRSAGISRAHKYGLGFSEYIKNANNETIIILQIEHIDAIENLDEILSVKHIDGVFIGPYDLSGSLNLLGDINHEKVQLAINTIKVKCKEYNLPFGFYGMTPESMEENIKDGCKYILTGIDTVSLGQYSSNLLKGLKTITTKYS